MGIPTAPMVGDIFQNYLMTYDMVYNTGMPLRFTYLPMPIAGMPPEVHKAYIEGEDPTTNMPVMQEVIEALTKPLTASEQITETPPQAAPQPRLLDPDTEENLQQLFIKKDWTDGLPIILPTEARVAAMLKGSKHKPDEVVVTVRGRSVAVEKVAICAVMAGAKPEYLPVILAIAASGQITFGSTTSMSKMVVVNGPIRKEIDMNSGMGALGPFNQANAVIGRAVTIMCKALGNSHLGGSYVGSLGSNIQYNNMCFAENEERLPQGWNSTSVQMGFKPTDSVVTLFNGWSYISSVGEMSAYPAHMWIRDYMRALSGFGSIETLIIDPLGAKHLKEVEGFGTKEMLHQWLSENVEIPARQYWGNGVVATFNLPLAYQGLEPYSTWQKVPPDTLIKPFNNPKNINTVVVGGGTQTIWFMTDMRLVKSVSVDAWR